MIRSPLVASILTVALCSIPLEGQRPLYGDRIRARPLAGAPAGQQAEWLEASAVRLAGDTLWYATSRGASPRRLLLSEHEVLVGRNGRTVGMILGGLVGAGVGAGVAYATFEPRYASDLGDVIGCIFTGCDPPQRQVNSRSDRTLTGLSIGAGAGVLFGWLVGRSIWTWSPVEVVQLAASGDDFAIVLRIGGFPQD